MLLTFRVVTTSVNVGCVDQHLMSLRHSTVNPCNLLFNNWPTNTWSVSRCFGVT